MENTAPYDLVVIGTGSANTILDERFETWRIAIVERDVFGGTCLNRGCIPSKMLIYPADVIMETRRLEALGVDVSVDRIRWPDMRDRIFGRIDAIAAGGEDYRRSQAHIDVISGDGRFTGHKQLSVTAPDGTVTEVRGDRFLLAAGARATLPDIPGLEEVGVHTSDTIMRIDEVPPRLGIIGGGFIAVEQAHLWEAFGSEVNMFVRRRTLLAEEDVDISERISQVSGERFDMHYGTQVVSVERSATGILVSTVAADGSAGTTEVDQLLVATGRTPNGDQLSVEATGVELDGSGLVITDDHLRCGVEGIYALGDIRTKEQLKHLANHEARVVQHNLLHPSELIAIDERAVPHAVFGSPQIASVGLTQQALEHSGMDFVIGRRDFGGVAYGWAMEDTEGFVKVLVDPVTRTLLGAHVIGYQAAILIQPLVQAMVFQQTVDAVASHQMWPHPALSEVIENALLDAR